MYAAHNAPGPQTSGALSEWRRAHEQFSGEILEKKQPPVFRSRRSLSLYKGVPQGSALGPVLFTLHRHDFIPPNQYFIHFNADDAVLYVTLFSLTLILSSCNFLIIEFNADTILHIHHCFCAAFKWCSDHSLWAVQILRNLSWFIQDEFSRRQSILK